jgi:hypothetical protein
MAERNDERFIEDLMLAFVIYADERGLTFEEGLDLAERAWAAIEIGADERRSADG